jgi:hypothetical protein
MTRPLAERRHETERVRARRAGYRSFGLSAPETPKNCSCFMCGNPRKWFGEPTVQEKKMSQRGADE